jgi:uncharacterized protein (TIGR03000 family)
MPLLAVLVLASCGLADSCDECRRNDDGAIFRPDGAVFDPAAYRQCRGAFFSKEASAWFEVDCLVRMEQAQPGLFVPAQIPGVGAKKLWLVEVYSQPKTAAPKGWQQLSTTNPQANSATIIVTLPQDAQLFVNDRQVEALPGRHEVLVRNLAAGVVYQYRLKALLGREDGRLPDQRKISFAAGDTLTVDFTKPAAESTASN